MSDTLTIDSLDDMDIKVIRAWLEPQVKDGDRFVLTMTKVGKVRTLKQNSSLHKWCEQTAEGLNAAGLDMKKTLRQEAEIPWNKDLVKEHIWRPVMKAVAGVESTKDMDTVDPTPILEVITRHLANTHGFQTPDWPSIDTMIWGQREVAA